MRLRSALGVVLLSLAIATCLLLGTLGWLAVGFGTMTDCTTDYSCGPGDCSPCRETQAWITIGGLAQLALAVVGIVALVRGLRTDRPARLGVAGAVLLAVSVLTVVVTTWQARESYCRPGTPGYAGSYCAVEAVGAVRYRPETQSRSI